MLTAPMLISSRSALHSSNISAVFLCSHTYHCRTTEQIDITFVGRGKSIAVNKTHDVVKGNIIVMSVAVRSPTGTYPLPTGPPMPTVKARSVRFLWRSGGSRSENTPG